jgi:hypothetical protein
MHDFRRQRGYPLTALFVLVGICAVLAAMLGPAINTVTARRTEMSTFVGSAVGSSILVAILGLVIGLYHHRRLRGVLVGGATGGIVGFLVGPLTVVPVEGLASLIVASLGGSVTLVAIGVIVRVRVRGEKDGKEGQRPKEEGHSEMDEAGERE